MDQKYHGVFARGQRLAMELVNRTAIGKKLTRDCFDLTGGRTTVRIRGHRLPGQEQEQSDSRSNLAQHNEFFGRLLYRDPIQAPLVQQALLRRTTLLMPIACRLLVMYPLYDRPPSVADPFLAFCVTVFCLTAPGFLFSRFRDCLQPVKTVDDCGARGLRDLEAEFQGRIMALSQQNLIDITKITVGQRLENTSRSAHAALDSQQK
jgi:hypothetical protein